MTISSVTSAINKLVDTQKAKAMELPAILLRAVAMQRPGISAQDIASKVIERNKQIGIPTGDNQDGTQNLVNMYTYNIVKSVVEALKEDGVIQVSIPANSIIIQATGGNAGGPVTVVGTNIKDTKAYGIIQ